MFKSPIDFAENIQYAKHIVMFYENVEYARSVSFAFLKAGMKNREHCFYFTSEEDTDFIKNEFIETMFGPNVTYEYNTSVDTKFDENLLHVENYSRSVGDDSSSYSFTENIVNVVNKIVQTKDKNETIISKAPNYSRILLKFNDKLKSKVLIENNVHWEKNFRNAILRKNLPNTSLVSAYPLDEITEIVNGQSGLLSYWMSELLELYDGVIYSKENWRGVGFNLDM